MDKNLYIDASHPEETRIVLKSNLSIEEYEYENKNRVNFKNNIYLGTISRVEPSLQAAFVDYGSNKHGFLAYNEIHPDYFKIPTADKEKLLAEEENQRMSNSNELFDDDDTKDEDEEYCYEHEKKPSFMEKIVDFFKFKPLDDHFIVRADKTYNLFCFIWWNKAIFKWNKEYKKYETCRLKKVEVNMKDGEKDGFKCIFKRQLKGKDVTVFQPTAQCMSSFKCKREIQD